MEVFRIIERFPKYFVSNKGNVLSFARFKDGRLLHKQKESIGYLSVKLSEKGKYKTILIHRLVAETFIPNPLNKRTVNHIDGDKQNNFLENLEWCTFSENSIHAVKNNLIKRVYGEDCHNSKFKKEDIARIFYLSKSLSARKISKIYGVCNTTISDILKQKSYTLKQQINLKSK